MSRPFAPLRSCLAFMAVAASFSACNQRSLVPAPPVTATDTPSPTLIALAVTPATAELASGASEPLTALGSFSDGTTGDVSELVAWTSTDPRVATVAADTSGATLYAGDAGSADVTAVLGTLSATAHVTVAVALRALIVSGPPRIAACGAHGYCAVASFSDGSERDVSALADWSTSDATLAILAGSDAPGFITALAAGPVTVSARWSGIAASLALVADGTIARALTISPGNQSVTAGDAIAFTATATYCDGGTQDVTLAATWSSSSPLVATIDAVEAGMHIAYTLDAGVSFIAAELDDVADAIQLQVAPPTLRSIFIAMPAAAGSDTTVAVGSSTALSATAEYSNGASNDVTGTVTWSSSDSSLATVSSDGVVTAIAAGQVTIMVEMNGLFGSLALTVQ